MFPGRGQVTWRDWYSQEKVNPSPIVGANTTLPAPLSHINVHIRDGAALLLHARPAYTIEETRQGPFSLLVSLSESSSTAAFGTAFLDDGVSSPPGPSTTVTFTATVRAGSGGELTIRSKGEFKVSQKLEEVTILGVKTRPARVMLQGKEILGLGSSGSGWQFTESLEKLVVSNASIALDDPVGTTTLTWV